MAHTTYLVTITRAAPDPTDAALSSLSVDGYELTPAFDAETDDYALTVPGEQNTLSLHAVSRSLSAGLSVSPADADPLEPGHQIPLTEVEPGGEPSLTTITLSVTSADGAATRTYTITVTKTGAWQPSKLMSLSIWAPHTFPTGLLTPVFSRSQDNYHASLDSYRTSVQIRAEPLSATQLLELDHPDAVPNASGWQNRLGPVRSRDRQALETGGQIARSFHLHHIHHQGHEAGSR